MLYFLALLSLSTAANWAKLNHMPAEVLGFWRLSLASVVLLLFFLIKNDRSFLKPPQKNLKWVLLSGFFFFLHLWTYKYAAKHTTIANTMILFSSNPLWATLGGIVFFKEQFKKRFLLSYLLALIGIYYLFSESLAFSPENHQGNMVALLSAFLYAVYMLTGKKARENYKNTTYAFYQYGLAALCFGLATLWNKDSFFAGADVTSWIAVIGLVALPTFLGHFTFTHLVKSMNLAFMTTGKLIEPIFASLIAYLAFKEPLQPSFYVAFILTSLAIIILFWPHIYDYFKKERTLP